ncbi:hypothetical protein D3C85_577060 [compost metagenome]
MAPTCGLGSLAGATTALTHQVPNTATAWPLFTAPTADSDASRSIAPIATGKPAGSPQAAARAGSKRPITVPVGTMGGKARAIRPDRPAASNASADHSPDCRDSRPAVLASLASVAISPHNRKLR